jgi:adhesin transport system outer membrane protein
MRNFSKLPVYFCLLVFCFSVIFLSPLVGEAETLKDVIQKAVLTDPEVQEKWHSFMAAGFEKEAAAGGARPQVDITAGAGRDSIDGKGYEDRDSFDYSNHGFSVTLRQMIYDGGLTRNQVNKLDHREMARYYELMSSIESVSLEAMRAFEDVIRYRELILLAEDNYLRHREVMDLVEDRFSKGYDSRSSLDEIRGRLSVAKVNKLTEEANLHDVSARYERIVGELPPKELKPSRGNMDIPTSSDLALKKAIEGNPSLFASRENVLASQAAIEENKAYLRPRIDLKGGYNSDHDRDGVDGRKDKWYGEILLTYKLYDGGTRKARVKQYEELEKQSMSGLQVKGRHIRQSLKVAYNDIEILTEQLEYLRGHKSATDKVRKAYAQQFRIGRRSLIDLLDTENEYYQASRALVNAEFNIVISKGRVLASMGELASFFNAARSDVPTLEGLDIEDSRYDFGPSHDEIGDDSFFPVEIPVEEIRKN